MIGARVKFTDEHRAQHDALVTHIHSVEDQTLGKWSINLVYVSADESQHDQYGRQIVRKTSVPVMNENTLPAGGYFYEVVD